MAGVAIEKLPHSCGTSSGLQVFADPDSGKVDGWCYSCGTYIRHPYGKEIGADEIELPEPKTEAQIQAELAEVSGYGVRSIKSRMLREEHLDAFGVKVSLSEEDGKTPTALYFPMEKKGKTTGYYIKSLSESGGTYAIGDVKSAEPFGWARARGSGAYKLIITEGLIDAVSVEAIFARYGEEKYKPAVISLPNGTQSVKSSLGPLADIISKTFKEVVLCFDDDDAGHRAVQDAMIILPKALSVTLPRKDANDCIMAGMSKAAHKAMSFQAFKPKNTRLIIADKELHEEARTPTPYGQLTWPYPKMNKLLRNIRYGELIFIGAGVKMGKSELLNDIAGHFIKEHGIKVFLAKPEEQIKKTYKLLCNKAVAKVFHDPDVEFDYEAYDKAGEILRDKLYILDLYQHSNWETLKQDIVSAAGDGVKAVFIDPITNLTNGMNAADANVKLQEISQDLSAMALDLDIVIFVFCHLKAPDGNISREVRRKKYEKGEYIKLGNCPQEYGGDVTSSQFAGSRAMMRSCNLMIALEGNKDEELPDRIRNMRWLTILEDREFGNSATVPLFWNKKTTLFKEV